MSEELKQVQTLYGDRDSLSHLSWSPNGSLLAARGSDAMIRVWAVDTGKVVATSEEPWTGISSLKWSPRGQILASCRSTYVVRLWDLTAKSVHQLQGDVSSIENMAWSPDGTILVVGGRRDRRIQFWKVDTQEIVETLDLPGSTYDLAWLSGNGMLAAVTKDTVYIRKPSGETFQRTLPADFHVGNLTWSPDGKVLASGVAEGVRLWHFESNREIGVLETSWGNVTSVVFSSDGALLAFISHSGTVDLWACNGWGKLNTIQADQDRYDTKQTIAFSPDQRHLALPGTSGTSINIWSLNIETLLERAAQISTALYTTVKVALVGRSGVGKTVLGWRLVHDAFKEHPSTHGQHFWLFESLQYVRPDGTHCDVVLWDLAGQPDYRITHVLFLDDVDLALVLFDSSDQTEPLKDVEYWLKQLPIGCRKILVGSKSDRGCSSVAKRDLAEFCDYHQITGGSLDTSAFSGERVAELIELIKDEIDLVELRASIATSTFSLIKKYVLGLKERVHHQKWKGQNSAAVIVTLAELGQQLQEGLSSLEFSAEELSAAVSHLERHGFVKRITTSAGKEVVLLIPELLNNLAASFILEARRNDRGLGAIDEGAIINGDLQFQELVDLSLPERVILLDATVSLLIARNVCCRAVIGNTSLLIFPALINQKRPLISGQGITEATTFIATGATENVYAGIVVLLGYTNAFTRTHQWQNQAEYEIGQGLVCGLRMVEENEGEIQLVLYFGERVPEYERQLFEGLFETFLRRPKLKVKKYPPVKCNKCENLLPRALLVEYKSKNKESVFCPKCGNNIFIGVRLPTSREVETKERMVQVHTRNEWQQTQLKTLFETALVRLHRFRNTKGASVKNPTCFVSYAWGQSRVEQWVLRLTRDLRNVQIEVFLDQSHNAEAGAHIGRYIEKLETCDFIIIVGTPLYKTKRSERSTLSVEIDAIQATILDLSSREQKIIPLLREGEAEESLPILFRGSVLIDFRDDKLYFARLFDLILNVHGISPSESSFADFREVLLGRRWDVADAHQVVSMETGELPGE